MSKGNLAELSGVVEKSRKATVQHVKQLASLTTFDQMLTRVVRKQAPVVFDLMAYLVEPFAAAIAHETTITDAEALFVEDLNDLAARYEVVWRVTE
jgi:ribosomal protein L10